MERAKPSTQIERTLSLVSERGILRASELAKHDLPRMTLTRLLRDGKLVRVARGVYALPDFVPTEHHGLVEASLRIPGAVICLLSALRFHAMTTQAPHEIWLALPRGRIKAPVEPQLPLRFVTMAPELLDTGAQSYEVEGQIVRVTTPARTVTDCFKFRNKIGLDVALEALKDYRRKRIGTLDELHFAARACRVAQVMQPYLEAIG